MINLAGIQQKITRSYGRGTLILKKYSPEILLGVGLVGVVTAAVMAAKATLKAQEIVDETKKDLEVIKTAAQLKTYTEEEKTQDLAIVYVQTGFKFARLYGPALGVGVLSITAILASHGIMNRRQVALVAAYNLLNEGYQSYRQRVIEEHGENADKMYHLGVRSEEYTEKEIDGEGKPTKIKKNSHRYDPNVKSVYARFFDESSPEWQKDSSLNLYFVKARQNYANDILLSRGHIFLNEVYDMLGFPHTKEGAIVGWLLQKDCEDTANGDGYVDFDIYNIENAPGRDFVNGYNRAILLDFNVDGIIFDLI